MSMGPQIKVGLNCFANVSMLSRLKLVDSGLVISGQKLQASCIEIHQTFKSQEAL